jgi:hypothetical protein
MSFVRSPGPWVVLVPRENDDDDENAGSFSYPGGIEDNNGDPVCEFGTLAGSGNMFWNPANAAMIAATPAMLDAIQAQVAWSYAEHKGLGSFEQRCSLCAYVEFLSEKAFALAIGQHFNQSYKGAKSMIVWPVVELQESTEADGKALVDVVLFVRAKELEKSS